MYIAIILTKNVPWKSLTKIISSSSRSDYSITSSQRFHFSQLHQTFTSLSTDFVIIWHPSFADKARSTHTNKRSNNYWRLLRQGSVCVCVSPPPPTTYTHCTCSVTTALTRYYSWCQPPPPPPRIARGENEWLHS